LAILNLNFRALFTKHETITRRIKTCDVLGFYKTSYRSRWAWFCFGIHSNQVSCELVYFGNTATAKLNYLK